MYVWEVDPQNNLNLTLACPIQTKLAQFTHWVWVLDKVDVEIGCFPNCDVQGGMRQLRELNNFINIIFNKRKGNLDLCK